MSPGRRNIRPGTGTGNAIETVKAVGPETRKGPSRTVRLARALASGLLNQDDGRDREDDDYEPDPWDELPEELDPDDTDALTDDDYVDDVDDKPLVPRSARSRPIITFSRFSGWSQRPGALTAHALGRPTRSAPRAPGMQVRTAATPGGGPDRDEVAASEAEAELEAIAQALADHQPSAILASNRLGAYDELQPMTERALAEAAGCDVAALSRRRRSLIACPWGVVPLEYFWWKRHDGLRVAEARRLVSILQDQPRTANLAAAAQVVAADRLADPEERRRRTDTIRKQVPVVRAILPHLDLLNGWSAAFPFTDEEELEKQLGLTPGVRGKGLVRLALIGCFAGRSERCS